MVAKDMTDFIKRDRNHPSIIMWSIGNEVTGATPKSNTTWSAYFTNWTLTALSLKEELILLEV